MDAPTPVPPPSRTPVGVRALRALWEWARSLSLALVLFLVLRATLVEAFKIPSGSMESTLLVGDFLLVNKLVYGAEVPLSDRRFPAVRSPSRGEVIVFQWPEDPEKNFVKRVVGLAGDTLAMRDGVLVRNGASVAEHYVHRDPPHGDPVADEFRWQREFLATTAYAERVRYHPSRDNWGPLAVPPGHLFVLGDNRDNSLDSRYWGFVADSLVRGRPLFVYFSYVPDSTDRVAWLRHIRWSRIGNVVR
ncbi:MAG: signal peptidase I [Gemmatimonadaceae bacterium]|nr:signal peptidase I [Gemmatimonadaceae bacterium]